MWSVLVQQQVASSFTTSDWTRRWWASHRTGDQSAHLLSEQVQVVVSRPLHALPFNLSLTVFSLSLSLSLSLSPADGPPIMASGSPQGHIAFWDLDRRQLVTQQRHAHSTAVAMATYLHGEPLLVTNGADNAIKVRHTQTQIRGKIQLTLSMVVFHHQFCFSLNTRCMFCYTTCKHTTCICSENLKEVELQTHSHFYKDIQKELTMKLCFSGLRNDPPLSALVFSSQLVTTLSLFFAGVDIWSGGGRSQTPAESSGSQCSTHHHPSPWQRWKKHSERW